MPVMHEDEGFFYSESERDVSPVFVICVHPAIWVVAQLYTEKEQLEGQGANEVKVRSSRTNDTPRTSVEKNNEKCREPMINR